MTDPQGFTATDLRRAAALLCHLAADDYVGVRLILDEAEQDGDSPALVVAVAWTALEIAPGLRSPEGLAALRELTRDHAEQESEPDSDA